jgi:hypothetical protein
MSTEAGTFRLSDDQVQMCGAAESKSEESSVSSTLAATLRDMNEDTKVLQLSQCRDALDNVLRLHSAQKLIQAGKLLQQVCTFRVLNLANSIEAQMLSQVEKSMESVETTLSQFLEDDLDRISELENIRERYESCKAGLMDISSNDEWIFSQASCFGDRR